MSFIRGWLYRAVMRIAHRFHWHYAPPIYPEGDTQLWCKWCGFRQTVSRREKISDIQRFAEILPHQHKAFSEGLEAMLAKNPDGEDARAHRFMQEQDTGNIVDDFISHREKNK